MIAALISSVANAFGLVVDKMILSKERVSLHVFLPISFIFLFVMTVILLPFLGNVQWDLALLPNTLFLLFLMILVAIAWNVLTTQSVQRERMHEHEMIMMSAPLVTIILAAVFYPEEYNSKILILAIIASLALFFSRAQKEHFSSRVVSYNTFLGVVLMSVESIIIKELLVTYTPVALYAVRTGSMALFFMAYYRPRYAQVSLKHWWLIFLSSFVGAAYMLGKFYAFNQFGIVYTTLIAILAPVMVFIASWEIMHERIRPRVLVAALVVLACAVMATFVNFSH